MPTARRSPKITEGERRAATAECGGWLADDWAEQTRRESALVSLTNVHKCVHKPHENGPRKNLRGPFYLVAGTGFEPATSGL